jgi:ABC-type multidrug transport system fused ATPase/permease subunit
LDPKPEDKAPTITEEVGACGYFELFKKGDRSMKLLVLIGHIFAAAQGVSHGLFGIILGNSTGELAAENPAGLTVVVTKIALKSVFFGIATMVFAALSKYIWTYLQNTLSHRVKWLYFSKILENDMSCYDQKSREKITSQYNIDSLAFQEGVGYANGRISFTIATALTGLTIGFYTAPIFA